MAGHDYHFVTEWHVGGDLHEVADILEDTASLKEWWPSVYLDVRILEPGGEHGIGKLVALHTRGRLPYTLRWVFRVIESRYPYGYTLDAWGDFEGRGVWTLKQNGPWVDVGYDWRIRAQKPLIRYLSVLFRPVFSANHRWAMARGEESLKRELVRRRARSAAAD